MMSTEEFVDEERITPDPSLTTAHSDEESGGSLVCDPMQDQLPDVEAYKATMGYEQRSPNSRGILKGKIIKRMAKRMSATPIELTDSSDGSASGEDPNSIRRGMDPPEEYTSPRWGQFVSDPSKEGFMDSCNGCGLPRTKRHSIRSGWKCCGLVTFGALLAAIGIGVISMTLNSWSNGQARGSDVHTREFIQGETKEFMKVCHYLLHVGFLPYSHNYDDYDPNSNESVPTTLVPQPLAKHETLLDESSPQYLAAQWLAHGDAASISVPTINQKEFNQRYAMATVYFALGGDRWTRSYNFMTSGHICTWMEEYSLKDIAEAAASGSNGKLADLVDIHGVNAEDMDESSMEQTVIHGVHDCARDADGNLYPRALYLPHNHLFGSIPDEIAILNELELLNIEFNGMVSGKLTDRLQELQSLRHLGLQFCNHEGHIPKWLPTLSNLEFLGLGSNRFDGNIPEDIALLTNLKLLGLDNNLVHGDLAMYTPLANLESLYLRGTFIEGGIESEYMELWPNLVELDVSSTDLKGTLPANFWEMVYPNLKVLDLHGNNFDGTIPSPPAQNAISGQPWELEYLSLSNNQFTGMLPDSISHFGKLKHLDVSENAMSFELPSTLAELTNLEYLIAGNNQFLQTEFPKFLIELTNLRELSLGGANLNGTIPAFLQYLSNLEILDLNKNRLSGTIPSALASLTKLRHLILKDNHLTGDFPSYLSQLTNLDVLLLEQNGFQGSANAICSSGPIPTFVADCGGSNSNGPTEWTVDNFQSSQQPGHERRRTAGEVGDLIGGGDFAPPSDQGDWTGNNVDNPYPTKDGDVGGFIGGGDFAPPSDQGDWTGNNVDNPYPTKDGDIGGFIGGGDFPPPSEQGDWTGSAVDNPYPTKDGDVGGFIGGGDFAPPSDQGDWTGNNVDNPYPTKDGDVGGFIGGGDFAPPSDQGDWTGSTVDNPYPTKDGNVGDMISGNNFPTSEQIGTITCSCCSMCCDAGDHSCHNWIRKDSADTIWKYGYKKKRYSYHF